MKLYMHPAAPNCLKVMIAGAQLEIPLEYQVVDLFRNEQRSQSYLEINPTGLVPALSDDDFLLWESNAIMQYIASKRQNDLWPDHPRIRADITRWQCWELAHWTPAVSVYLRENLFKRLKGAGGPNLEELRKADERFHPLAQLLDRHLAQCTWLVNDRLTLADISIASFLAYEGPARVPLESYANVKRWLSAVGTLSAWQTVQSGLAA